MRLLKTLQAARIGGLLAFFSHKKANVIFFAGVVSPFVLYLPAPLIPTFFSEAIAFGGWGIAIYLIGLEGRLTHIPQPLIYFLVGLTALFIFAVVGVRRGLPVGMAAVYGLELIAAAVCALAGSMCSARWAYAFIWALFVAALFSSIICFVQLFLPANVDGLLIAAPWGQGRLGGNLRQPNQLACILAVGIACLVPRFEVCAAKPYVKYLVVMMLVLALAGTGSRLGAMYTVLFGAWGFFDRLLSRRTRIYLALLPLAMLIAVGLLYEWSRFDGTAHLRSAQFGDSRTQLWQQAFALVQLHPFLGIGLAEFNFAWTLTPLGQRGIGTYTHAHNLLLQWMVELGAPSAIAIIGVFTAFFGKLFQLTFAVQAVGPDALVRRCCFIVIACILLYSMTEFPLWYGYFLLLFSFACGICCQFCFSVSETFASRSYTRKKLPLFAGIGLAVVLTTALVTLDFQTAAQIFLPSIPGTPELDQRVKRARESVLFGSYADRFAGTLARQGYRDLEPYKEGVHHMLDMRLLIAWSLAMRETGHLDKARYLAQRIKEFNDPVAQQFFDKCNQSAGGRELPWQCTPPTGHYSYQDFL